MKLLNSWARQAGISGVDVPALRTQSAESVFLCIEQLELTDLVRFHTTSELEHA